MRFKSPINPCWKHYYKILALSVILLMITDVIPVCGQSYPDDFLNGRIERIQSKILHQEHLLFVYLPRNYKETQQAYPVHYITDAPGPSNIFYSLLSLQSYVNAMPQSIVVGLSSDNREYNMHTKQDASQYLNFLVTEVIPFIEQHYRTEPYRSIAGHSLGGGFALYALLKRPDLFNACIAGSPYPLAYLSSILKGSNTLADTTGYHFLYSSTGTVEDINPNEFQDFQAAFETKAPQKYEYHFQVNEGENHISNIAINFQDGLEALYSDWKFVLPETLSTPADQLLEEHFKKLSQKLGYRVVPQEWEVIFPMMDQLAKQGDFENAIRILKYCIRLYPESDQAYAFLGRAYISIGNKALGKKNIEKALSLNPNNKFALNLQHMLEQ